MRKIFVISALGLMMSASYTQAGGVKVPVKKDVGVQTEALTRDASTAQKTEADLKGSETSTHPIVIEQDTETRKVSTDVPAGSPAPSKVVEKKGIALQTEAPTSDGTAAELQAANEKVEALTAQKKEADLKVQELNAQRTKIVQEKDAEIRRINLEAQEKLAELVKTLDEAKLDQARFQKDIANAKAEVALIKKRMADQDKQKKTQAALEAAQLRAAQLKK